MPIDEGTEEMVAGAAVNSLLLLLFSLETIDSISMSRVVVVVAAELGQAYANGLVADAERR